MCANKTVSVIIPAYNAQDLLPRCLKSVFSQSYTQLEIVVIDDGSHDKTLDVANRLASEDSRCTVIHQDNGGLSSARNTGIDFSSGAFLFFLDSDDHIDQHEIEELVRVQSETDADMVVGGFIYEDADGKAISTVCAPYALLDEKRYWEQGTTSSAAVEYIVAWGKLYKRDLFSSERYDIAKLHEDEYIIHRITSKCSRIAIAELNGYHYVQTPGSITHTATINNYLDKSEAILIRADYFFRKGWKPLAWRSIVSAKGPLMNASDPLTRKGQKETRRLEQLRTAWIEQYGRLKRTYRPKTLSNHNLSCLAYRYAPTLCQVLRKKLNHHE